MFGVYAVNLVEMESSLGLDTYKDQQSMEEKNVLDLPENQEIVLEIIAQVMCCSLFYSCAFKKYHLKQHQAIRLLKEL